MFDHVAQLRISPKYGVHSEPYYLHITPCQLDRGVKGKGQSGVLQRTCRNRVYLSAVRVVACM